jgi:hypothetical protein
LSVLVASIATNVFRPLEAELGRHADLDREAVGAQQRLVVVAQRELRLRMQQRRHVEGVAVALGTLE